MSVKQFIHEDLQIYRRKLNKYVISLLEVLGCWSETQLQADGNLN